MKPIYIFDTTLRDGEQSPGVALNIGEKLDIARQLKRLGVNVIEAGFPIASQGDFAAVQAVAREIKGPVIAGLARANKADIDRAWEALKDADKPRIHVFIATSEIHMKYKLRKTPDEVLAAATEAVRYAKSLCKDIEFSAEDASRSNIDFLSKVVTEVIKAGANVVNIPDTVGYATPNEFGDFLRKLIAKTPNIDQAIISVHCHNDLGLAVANSLAAIEAGAQQIECTVNGIGERAGNAALEELVMGLYTRADYYQAKTSIVTQEIFRSSTLVGRLSGMFVQHNKAVVGKNAFAHESGIHQDGVLKERTTYEIMNPKLIGVDTDQIVLGKHSGRHAFKERMTELGFELEGEALDKAFFHFKALADRKKDISTADLIALMGEQKQAPAACKLDLLQVSSGNRTVATATIGLIINDKLMEEAACGDGPVDAAFKAIDKVTGAGGVLISYQLEAISGGMDAQGAVTVRVQFNGKPVVGFGVSTDIIESSVKAYIDAYNRAVQAGLVKLPSATVQQA
ncbi:MAG TPA: 2-isopropylmalate synthase [Desulfobacteria bacterium]|nr:2-isopropylmalate synthase [Desulfobacteria bacterium]